MGLAKMGLRLSMSTGAQEDSVVSGMEKKLRDGMLSFKSSLCFRFCYMHKARKRIWLLLRMLMGTQENSGVSNVGKKLQDAELRNSRIHDQG